MAASAFALLRQSHSVGALTTSRAAEKQNQPTTFGKVLRHKPAIATKQQLARPFWLAVTSPAPNPFFPSAVEFVRCFDSLREQGSRAIVATLPSTLPVQVEGYMLT